MTQAKNTKNLKKTSESLLTPSETAKIFGFKKAAFYKYLPKFKAYGLQRIQFGKKGCRFSATSVDACIRNMAESEAHLVVD